MGDDRLLIFGGLYTEFVRVAKKNGTPGNPIVIEGVVGITPRRLKSGSPARNAGVLLPIYFQQMDVDAAGVAVPDIGAYQRQRTTGLAANCFPPQNWQATAKYLRGFRAACVGKRCHFVSDGN